MSRPLSGASVLRNETSVDAVELFDRASLRECENNEDMMRLVPDIKVRRKGTEQEWRREPAREEAKMRKEGRGGGWKAPPVARVVPLCPDCNFTPGAVGKERSRCPGGGHGVIGKPGT